MKKESTFLTRILVPKDGSKCSLEAAYRAFELTKKHSEIIALYIIFIPSSPGLSSSTKKIYRHAEKEACKWLNSLQRKAEAEDVKFRAVALKSKDSIIFPIAEFAAKNDIDLIILGTSGRTQYRKTLLGSVASGIASYAPCSVMVVG